MDEVTLAEALIAIDTSRLDGIETALEYIEGWCSGRDLPVEELRFGDRRCLRVSVGEGPLRVMLNGHVDVVPGEPGQFTPQRRGDRLYGRGAYDMKAAVAAMMLAVGDLVGESDPGVQVDLLIVPDEERAAPGANCSELVVADGYRADFVICGEPTDFHVGVHAKGVAIMEMRVPGLAAHSSTPWLGRNAILRTVEMMPRIETCPFMEGRGTLLGSPSVNLSTIVGGDAVNCVPAHCTATLDVRFVPGQSADEILQQIRDLDPEVEVEMVISRPPADLNPDDPFVRSLRDAALPFSPDSRAVGRDGSSDAVAFLGAGVPAVEFGPVGAGHHGPEEWVSIESLGLYRRALVEFVRSLSSSPTVAGA
ncbi:MAG: M20/M25/M40 family metallo-hydrolase [Thermoleophilia bacterium]|nr:M20/M25/M40 family metallo-hydrolase [Thermoleophilia bacterium]